MKNWKHHVCKPYKYLDTVIKDIGVIWNFLLVKLQPGSEEGTKVINQDLHPFWIRRSTISTEPIASFRQKTLQPLFRT